MKAFFPSVRRRASHGALVLLACLTLAGCKQELYGNLTAQAANEMLAVLLETGLTATKSTSDNGKTWLVSVEGNEMAAAVRALQTQGLPRANYANLGTLFQSSGMVSTPTEERVRFIYGLSQQISETLSRIDGVLVARVEIVLPDNDPLANRVKPASAAVFIKYRPDADISAMTPQIKNLVMHSIEGLAYDAVSVTAVPAQHGSPALPNLPPPVKGPSVEMIAAIAAAGFGLLGMLASLAMLPAMRSAFRRIRPGTPIKRSDSSSIV